MTTEEMPPPPVVAPVPQNPRQAVDAFRRSLTPITPRAWVMPVIIALNVAVFVAFSLADKSVMEPSTQGLIQWGANYGPRTTGGQPWRLFTYMFMHIGLVHILMNMAVLWDIGRIVEKMTGNLGFLVAYLLSGLGGGIASVLWNPQVISAGASGAVFGVFGVLLGFLVRSRASVPPDVLKHLQKSAVVFIGYNVLYGLAKAGIDNSCHFGGVITGFVCGLVLAHPLTVEGASTRSKKALALLGAGLVLFGGISFALPHGVDWQAEVKAFGDVETPALDKYVKLFKDEKLTDEHMADVMEKEIIPPWKAAHERWKKLKGLPPEQQKIADVLERYQVARLEGFELMAQAGRKHDEKLMKQGLQREQDAKDMIDEMEKKQK